MRTSEYFSHLSMGPFMSLLNGFYTVVEGKETYPRRAMLRTMFWRRTEGIKFHTKVERYLRNYPEEALELGFELDEFGLVKIPNHRTFWHFECIRLRKEGQDRLFNLLRKEVAAEARMLGLSIGENTSTDSIPVSTRRNDSDGEWNPHYKMKMVKWPLIWDLDHLLPLAKGIDGGLAGDGKWLIPLLSDAADVARDMKCTWFDGGYNGNENLAKAYVLFDFDEIHYHLDANWRGQVRYKHSFKGKTYWYAPQKQVEYLYERRWKKPWYEPEASLEYKMKCLIQEGIYEPVAMHFRNVKMAEYEECPDGVLEAYHRRSVNEGIGGYLKEHWELEKFIRGKGMEKIDRDLTAMLNTVLAVALVRLQNGVTENLTSRAYLT